MAIYCISDIGVSFALLDTDLYHQFRNEARDAMAWGDDLVERLEKLPNLVSLEIGAANQLTTASVFYHLDGNSPHISREFYLVPRLK